MPARLVLVANPEAIHIGSFFGEALLRHGITTELADIRRGYDAPYWVSKFNWLFRDHRPARLNAFSEDVVDMCRRLRPQNVFCTGTVPLNAAALKTIATMGIKSFNFLTDDPFNKQHRAGWFVKSLPHYAHLFSPRRENMEELRALGCREVSYLPFGYAPEVHFPEKPSDAEKEKFDSELLFVGGADSDRIPYIHATLDADIKLVLWGGYWDKFSRTRPFAKGHANREQMRKAVSGAKVTLCLVRKANRDGNSMRSFEIPAMGGCTVVEDTTEHREIFGDTVSYFSNPAEMVECVRALLGNEVERIRLAKAAHERILKGSHSYEDRVSQMLEKVNAFPARSVAKPTSPELSL